ncbi:MAG TPA: hypothetical protein VGO34_03650 [Alphaproteobacteria bacterium]|jgi:hypothetical protein
MNALKALVIGMGLLIVAGIAVIAVTIIRRQDAPVAADPAAKPAVGLARSGPAAPPPASFGVRDIAVPADSEVMSVTAADGRIIVELRDPDNNTRLLLLDPVTGAPLGGWRLRETATPAPSAAP